MSPRFPSTAQQLYKVACSTLAPDSLLSKPHYSLSTCAPHLVRSSEHLHSNRFGPTIATAIVFISWRAVFRRCRLSTKSIGALSSWRTRTIFAVQDRLARYSRQPPAFIVARHSGAPTLYFLHYGCLRVHSYCFAIICVHLQPACH